MCHFWVRLFLFMLQLSKSKYAKICLPKSESKVEAEPEKNQSRYNLRRRKDDGDAKTAEAKAEQLDEKDAKLAAAPAPSLSTPIDFGGKIGRLQVRKEMHFHATVQLYSLALNLGRLTAVKGHRIVFGHTVHYPLFEGVFVLVLPSRSSVNNLKLFLKNGTQPV